MKVVNINQNSKEIEDALIKIREYEPTEIMVVCFKGKEYRLFGSTIADRHTKIGILAEMIDALIKMR